MREQPIIVLKFGGSVLLDEQRLRIAVHEIYRWRRDGYRVVAVVSALAGRTEALIKRCHSLSTDASDHAKAALIATGEIECSALLGIHLDQAGIPARVLTPPSVRLVARGNSMDADPVSIDTDRIHDALDDDGVVVFPGYLAIDEHGQTVTFGRGGSDLTALFLAHQLKATKCRLIKDVDGLYESDPASDGPPPKRYGHAGYAQALNTDGSIIQHKAVRFAQDHELEFELGRFNGSRPTTIGPDPTTTEAIPDRPVPLSVAICGLGTVGSGVLERLLQLPELFAVVQLACKTPSKHHDLINGPIPITDDVFACASLETDIVVELIGGIEIPLEITRNALASGSHVVTANKALLAQHRDEIDTLAACAERKVLASASVGGVVPVLESLRIRSVRGVHGVLNGTGNFVLGALDSGITLNDAIARAQQLGFAEADPSRDLDGRDSLDKLLVIAGQLGWSIPEESITRSCITQGNPESVGEGIAKQLASVSRGHARVTVERIDASGVLGQLRNEWNAVIVEYEDGTTQTLRGKGAGRSPTSESILADLLELSRKESQSQYNVSNQEVSYA